VGLNYNKWSLDALRDLRYRFEQASIVDTLGKGQRWEGRGRQEDTRVDQEYALITRLVRSHTGHPLVILGGLSTFGTQSAGELLTRPEFFDRFLAKAPKDWAERNLQIVVHTRVIGITPGPPDIVAVHAW